MRNLKVIFAVLVMLVGAASAQAQFRFGVKAGVTVNSLNLKDLPATVTDKSNQTGFTGGIMAEFTVPVIGVGADVSAMYVRRNTQFLEANGETYGGMENISRDYIEIPVNLKWKINIPAVSHIVRPYIATGPSFSFLTSKTGINEAFKNRKVDTAWNIGFGVQLINHLEIGARYGWGMNKVFEKTGVSEQLGLESTNINAKNNYWTVTAAWLF